MPILEILHYDSHIKEVKSESDMLTILKDVGEGLQKIDSSFDGRDLTAVLSVIERGSYDFESGGKRIDLSLARNQVKFYKEYSTGGCKSCVKIKRVVVDAQDATSFWYCEQHELTAEEAEKSCRYNAGFSKMITRHYEMPCSDWSPRFPKKIEELVRNSK